MGRAAAAFGGDRRPSDRRPAAPTIKNAHHGHRRSQSPAAVRIGGRGHPAAVEEEARRSRRDRRDPDRDRNRQGRARSAGAGGRRAGRDRQGDGGTVRRRPGDRQDRHRRQGRSRCSRGAAAPPLRRAAAAAAAAGRWRPRRRRRDARRRQADGRQRAAAGYVAGTGKDGRVTKGDVLGAVASRRNGQAPAPARRRRTGAPQAGAAASRRRRSTRPTSATAPSSACR